jgi:hypothetical protein
MSDPVLREFFSRDETISGAAPDNTLLTLVSLMLGLPKTMAASVRDQPSSGTVQSRSLGTWLTKAVQAAPDEQARLQEFLHSEPSIATHPVDAVMRWLPLVRPYLPLIFEELPHLAPADVSTQE